MIIKDGIWLNTFWLLLQGIKKNKSSTRNQQEKCVPHFRNVWFSYDVTASL